MDDKAHEVAPGVFITGITHHVYKPWRMRIVDWLITAAFLFTILAPVFFVLCVTEVVCYKSVVMK